MMYYMGFDIGGTKCAVVIGDEAGNILAKTKIATTTVNETLERIFAIAENYAAEYHPVSVGISCGGPLDPDEGVILSPPNLPGWDEIRAVDYIKEMTGVTARLENDANACAAAEWKFGAGKGTKNMVFLTFGTGMGAGLILDGKLYSGTNDGAGEVGHIRLAETGPEGYGKKGSFEGFCSGGGIRNLAILTAKDYLKNNKKSILFETEEDFDNLTAQNIAEAMYEGDTFAREVYEKCAEYLGRGLSVIIDILNPEAIVIGSIFESNQEFFVPLIEKIIKKEALGCNSEVCKILPAQLGDSIGDYAALGVLF